MMSHFPCKPIITGDLGICSMQTYSHSFFFSFFPFLSLSPTLTNWHIKTMHSLISGTLLELTQPLHTHTCTHTCKTVKLLSIHNLLFGLGRTASFPFGFTVGVTTTELVGIRFALCRVGRGRVGKGAPGLSLLFRSRLLIVWLGRLGRPVFPTSSIGCGVGIAPTSPISTVLWFHLAGRPIGPTLGGGGLWSRGSVLPVVGHAGVCLCAWGGAVVAPYPVSSSSSSSVTTAIIWKLSGG